LKRAYVDNWRREQSRCERAFRKWDEDADGLMSEATSTQPAVFFPLLPVVREKDKWKRDKFGTEYKVRLCLDLKQGGLNDMFLEWPFRYWGLECVAENVQQGDWLATLDISRFYLRLPAGQKLRDIQWFQDPDSYAKTTEGNERKPASKLRFRQLRSVAFGLKPAPAFASAVSMEAVRILRANGVQVAGVYLDDVLIRGKTEKECRRSMEKAIRILAELGIPTNDKACGPCSPTQGITFLGVHICTAVCSMSVTDEYRQYALQRVSDLLLTGIVSQKDLESVSGILSWIAQVYMPGRPRRQLLYRLLSKMKAERLDRARIDGELRQML